jgi:hypothetical protein
MVPNPFDELEICPTQTLPLILPKYLGRSGAVFATLYSSLLANNPICQSVCPWQAFTG